MVTITGTVASEIERDPAVEITRDNDGIKEVKGHLAIEPYQ